MLEKYRARLEPGMLDCLCRSERTSMGDSGDPVDEQRRRYREYCAAWRAPRAAGVAARDDSVAAGHGAIPIRVYRGAAAHAGSVLYMHGGGWIVGDLDTHDDVCSELAQHTGAQVVAVDYRLAPEYPYPAAFDDCCHVLDHLHADPARFGERVVVAGDSAGGNLAAALALRARDLELPAPAGQVLIYPGLCGDQSLPAYRELCDAPVISSDDVGYYVRTYLGQRAPDSYAVPLLASGYSALAPAYVSVAELDPLRDDGLVYAEKLLAAGVSAEAFVATGLTHSFLRARHASAGAGDAFDRIAKAIVAFLR